MFAESLEVAHETQSSAKRRLNTNEIQASNL